MARPDSDVAARGVARRTARLVAAAALALAFAGCGDDHGFVEGERLVVDDCGEDGAAREFAPFVLELTTFGIEPGEGPLFIRAQHHGEPLTGQDGLLIAVDDGDALREWRRTNAGVALPLGPAADGGETAPTTVRGSLLLAATCPDSYQPLELVGGTVVFETLGTENGDRVKLRFEGASVRDMRTDAIVGTGFVGEMDFEVRTGRPYRWYNP